MFKDESEFRKIINRLNIDTEPNPMHRDDLRAQMLRVFNEAKQQSQKPKTPHGALRRIIMKSPVTKIAAAAAIIIALLIGINHLGGSIDGATVALAEVRQALDEVKYMQSESYDKEQHFETSWSGSGIYCHKAVNGFCVYVTTNPDRKVEYFPKTKAIRISWPGEGYWGAHETPLQSIKRSLDHHVKYAKRTETNRGQLNGQEMDVVKIYGTREDANEIITIWCDPLSHLPLKLRRRDITVAYSYPEEAPADIYELGAPRSARVISTVPSEEVQELLNKFFKWRKSALKYRNMENMLGFLTPARIGQIIEHEYAQQHGLICLEELHLGGMWSQPDFPEINPLPTRRLFFFDPKKDYMWVRIENYVVPKASWQIDKNLLSEDQRISKPRHTIIDILEFGQAKGGVWFPVKVNEYDGDK